jgi:hypothetical protein
MEVSYIKILKINKIKKTFSSFLKSFYQNGGVALNRNIATFIFDGNHFTISLIQI